MEQKEGSADASSNEIVLAKIESLSSPGNESTEFVTNEMGEHVIGYLEIEPSELHLMQGNNTIYLQPEHLGEHMLVTESGEPGQIIVVVEQGSEDDVAELAQGTVVEAAFSRGENQAEEVLLDDQTIQAQELPSSDIEAKPESKTSESQNALNVNTETDKISSNSETKKSDCSSIPSSDLQDNQISDELNPIVTIKSSSQNSSSPSKTSTCKEIKVVSASVDKMSNSSITESSSEKSLEKSPSSNAHNDTSDTVKSFEVSKQDSEKNSESCSDNYKTSDELTDFLDQNKGGSQLVESKDHRINSVSGDESEDKVPNEIGQKSPLSRDNHDETIISDSENDGMDDSEMIVEDGQSSPDCLSKGKRETLQELEMTLKEAEETYLSVSKLVENDKMDYDAEASSKDVEENSTNEEFSTANSTPADIDGVLDEQPDDKVPDKDLVPQLKKAFQKILKDRDTSRQSSDIPHDSAEDNQHECEADKLGDETSTPETRGSGEELMAALELVPSFRGRQSANGCDLLDSSESKEDGPQTSGSSGATEKRWRLRTRSKEVKIVKVSETKTEQDSTKSSEDSKIPESNSTGELKIPTSNPEQKSKSEEMFDTLLKNFKKDAEKAQKEQEKKSRTPTRQKITKEKPSPKVKSDVKKSPGAQKMHFRVKTLNKEYLKSLLTSHPKESSPCKPLKRKAENVKFSTPKSAKIKSAFRLSSLVSPSPSKQAKNTPKVCDFRIRCQGNTPTPEKTVPSYFCFRCGFRTARMDNIIRHHKVECAFTKDFFSWDNDMLAKMTKTPTPKTHTLGPT